MRTTVPTSAPPLVIRRMPVSDGPAAPGAVLARREMKSSRTSVRASTRSRLRRAAASWGALSIHPGTLFIGMMRVNVRHYTAIP